MHMDRAIFELNASVEATSLYIIICSLMDEGLHPTLENIRFRWSGTEEALHEAVRELGACGVAATRGPVEEGQHIHLNPRNDWGCRQ